MKGCPVSFKDVKDLLDKVLVDSSQANDGDAPSLGGHQTAGKPPMTWNSAAELRAAWGKGVPLIQTEVIGNGNGATANLVVDLATGLGGRPRMPKGGPYLSPAEIQVIIDWIDGGCLDDPPPACPA